MQMLVTQHAACTRDLFAASQLASIARGTGPQRRLRNAGFVASSTVFAHSARQLTHGSCARDRELEARCQRVS
jgi:cytosine/adenosine deaminase-related metal-dependent hydrolase